MPTREALEAEALRTHLRAITNQADALVARFRRFDNPSHALPPALYDLRRRLRAPPSNTCGRIWTSISPHETREKLSRKRKRLA